MIKVNYNKEENIIYIERTGNIEFHEVLDFIKYIDENFKNWDNLYLIDDFRLSNSNYEIKDHPIFLSELKKRLSNFKEVRTAFIVDTPSETVQTIMFEKISQVADNYYCKTFCTMEAAKKWLKQ